MVRAKLSLWFMLKYSVNKERDDNPLSTKFCNTSFLLNLTNCYSSKCSCSMMICGYISFKGKPYMRHIASGAATQGDDWKLSILSMSALSLLSVHLIAMRS
ncbi:hypothetical protein Syun_017915 [Stephania yunnanensis]|uniref:Uncharacterized protein n=1 Tax=Stephania yunnanensis TaxID=152371 RepID=A0AAP0IRB0_9MAGN